MSGFPIIDLVLGMIFLYFLLSVISGSLVEIVQTITKARARILYHWLIQIFDKQVTLSSGTSKPLGIAIMDHCAAIAMSQKGKAPSYIDAKNFTTVLIDLITLNPLSPGTIATNLQQVSTAIQGSAAISDELKRTLLSFANDAAVAHPRLMQQAGSDMELFRIKVETWYDSNMDRLAGTLKRRWSGWLAMLFGVLISIGLNADSIAIARYLYSNPEARTQAANLAVQLVQDSAYMQQFSIPPAPPAGADSAEGINSPAELQRRIDASIQRIRRSEAVLSSVFPLGWNGDFGKGFDWTKFMGQMLTIIAITMGAPFWFDVLNKVANLRGTGPKPLSRTAGDFNRPK